MNKERLTLLLNAAPLPVVVDIALDFLGEQSVIDLLDYDDDTFEMFLSAIARPSHEEGIRDMAAIATEILSTIQELKPRVLSLSEAAEASMTKLVDQESN